MADNTQMIDVVAEREIMLTRHYLATKETMFALWTKAEHLAMWWGPDGFSCTKVESDPRPGGKLIIVMEGPGGFMETMTSTYREVLPPERIVVDSEVTMPDGTKVITSSYMVTFRSAGEGTDVTVQAKAGVYQEAGKLALAGMKAGWNQSLQCLDDALQGATDRELVFTRLYDAPPDKVFPLWTEEEHLAKWWGPNGFSISVESIDVRPGGRWVFVMHSPDGKDYPNRITYDEVIFPERIVYSHEGPDLANAQFHAIVTFDEMAGKTALSMRLIFPSVEAKRLNIDQYHSDVGGIETLCRLKGVVDTLRHHEQK